MLQKRTVRARLIVVMVLMFLFSLISPAIPNGGIVLAEDDPVVEIPDENLEAAIRDELEIPENDIKESDMEDLVFLDADEMGISDLTGLEYAINLEELYLSHNEISDISALSGLTEILWLDISFNCLDLTEEGETMTIISQLQVGANEVIYEPQKIKLTLEANPPEGGTVDGAGCYIEDEAVTVTAAANAGYRFVNWTVDGDVESTEADYDYTMPAEDTTLVANFEEVFDLTLEADPEEGGEVTDDTGEGPYAEGEEVNVSAAANAGYRFVNWTVDGDVESTEAEFEYTMPAEDTTLVAHFEELTDTPVITTGEQTVHDVNITIEGNAEADAAIIITGGAADAEGAADGDGSFSVEVTLTPDSVNNLSVTAHAPGKEVSEAATVDITHITLYDLTLEADPEEGGEVTDDTGEGVYAEGEVVSVSAAANAGYRFVNWTVDGDVESTEADFEYTMPAGDTTLVANFERVYELTLEVAEVGHPDFVGGAIDGDAGFYAEGDVISVTANPNTEHGYIFDFINGWRVDGVLISRQSTFDFTMPAADTTLTAHFMCPVTSIELDVSDLEKNIGQTRVLEATVLPENACNRNVYWSSDNRDAAVVFKTGVTTAIIIPVAEGEATIEARTGYYYRTDSVTVTVIDEEVPVSGINLDKVDLELLEGEEEYLTATIDPAYATQPDITWESADEDVVTVESLGSAAVITAVAAGGPVNITAKTVDGDYAGTCAVTVVAEGDGAPVLRRSDPEDNDDNVRVNKRIRVTFNTPIAAGDEFNNITLTDTDAGSPVDFASEIDATGLGNTLVIIPDEKLAYDTEYTVVIPAGAVQNSNDSSPSEAPVSITFKTAENPVPASQLDMNRNYFSIDDRDDSKDNIIIVPTLNDEATDHGVKWRLGGGSFGSEIAGGSYNIASAIGRGYGTLEHLYRGDTTWCSFTPTSPGVVNLIAQAEEGEIRNQVIIDVFFGYGIVTGTEVTIADVIQIARHVVGLSHLDRVQRRAADVSGDGSVHVGDVIRILRYIVDIIETFPAEEDE